jgi:GDP-D-mannose dehydratase
VGSLEETGIDLKTGKTVIRIDARYHRPTEVDTLIGNADKARRDALVARGGFRMAEPYE